jgi:S-adenosylmethionine hydrolase
MSRVLTMPRVVTLATDFGAGSGYVAEMKGRLLHAATDFTLVDISHDVPPHDVRAAAWLVGRACPAFPPGTLHLVVVDPGVGTARRIVWAKVGGHEYLAPDNGVLTEVIAAGGVTAAREIAVPAGAAATFHGRDVIAPAALRLLDGGDPATLGPAAGGLARLAGTGPRETPTGIVGEVIHVDAFGNLVTNLPARLWPRVLAAGGILVGPHPVTTLVRTYGDAPRGTLVGLVGSQEAVEAAVVEGRADARLGAAVGTTVTIPPARD